MVGPGAILHLVTGEGFSEEVILDLTPEDEKGARPVWIVPGSGKIFALFHPKILKKE